jgi:Holliday junction resolvase RusA-like endonuclease
MSASTMTSSSEHCGKNEQKNTRSEVIDLTGADHVTTPGADKIVPVFRIIFPGEPTTQDRHRMGWSNRGGKPKPYFFNPLGKKIVKDRGFALDWSNQSGQPKFGPKTRLFAGVEFYTKRNVAAIGDIDNLQKYFFDVLESVAYDNDRQICAVRAIKSRIIHGEAFTVVEVREAIDSDMGPTGS